MSYSLTKINELIGNDIRHRIFLLIACFMFFITPILSSIMLFLYGFFTNKNHSFYVMVFSFSTLLALIVSVTDLNYSYTGDISRYYYWYELGSYQTAIKDGKFFRAFCFYIMSLLDLREGFYSLFSIFLYTLSIQLGINALIRKGIIFSTFDKSIFYLLVFFSIGFAFLSSFEGAMSLSFFVLGFLFYLKRRNKKTMILCFIFSLLIHPSSLIPMLFLLIIVFFSRSLKSCVFVSLAIVVGLYVLSSFKVVTSFSYVDLLFRKFYDYANGPWGSFINNETHELPLYSLVTLFVFSIVVMLNIRSECSDCVYNLSLYNIFLLSWIVLSIFFIFYRTFSVRYIIAMSMIVSPYVFYTLLNKNISIPWKGALVVLITFSVMKIPNVYFLQSYFSQVKIGNERFVGMTWNDIKNFSIGVPSREKLGVKRL